MAKSCLRNDDEKTKANSKATFSEVEILRRQLAILERKFEIEEEDRLINSLSMVQNRGKKRSSGNSELKGKAKKKHQKNPM